MLKTVQNTGNKFNFFKALPLLLVLYAACSSHSDGEKRQQYVFTDALEREVKLAKMPGRVMALAPSMTEMLFFVCDTGQVVAITPNCDYPTVATQKPVVNSYPMDFEGLLRVKPDLVFTIETITPLADAKRMEEMGIPVYYQQYQTVEDILKGIETIGQLMGHEERAKHLADSLRTIQTVIRAETASLPKPSVLAITWHDPIYVYGKNTVFTDKLTSAGARNAVDTVFEAPYPALTREYILKINPDIIIGGNYEQMDQTFFKQYPELKQTKAYQNRRIYQLSDDLMARPSPRVMESIMELKEVIHPKPNP